MYTYLYGWNAKLRNSMVGKQPRILFYLSNSFFFTKLDYCQQILWHDSSECRRGIECSPVISYPRFDKHIWLHLRGKKTSYIRVYVEECYCLKMHSAVLRDCKRKHAFFPICQYFSDGFVKTNKHFLCSNISLFMLYFLSSQCIYLFNGWWVCTHTHTSIIIIIELYNIVFVSSTRKKHLEYYYFEYYK